MKRQLMFVKLRTAKMDAKIDRLLREKSSRPSLLGHQSEAVGKGTEEVAPCAEFHGQQITQSDFVRFRRRIEEETSVLLRQIEKPLRGEDSGPPKETRTEVTQSTLARFR